MERTKQNVLNHLSMVTSLLTKGIAGNKKRVSNKQFLGPSIGNSAVWNHATTASPKMLQTRNPLHMIPMSIQMPPKQICWPTSKPLPTGSLGLAPQSRLRGSHGQAECQAHYAKRRHREVGAEIERGLQALETGPGGAKKAQQVGWTRNIRISINQPYPSITVRSRDKVT